MPTSNGTLPLASRWKSPDRSRWKASVVLVIVLVSIPGYARLIRAQILVLKTQDFAVAAESLGFSRLRIMFRHLLPNCLPPLIVVGALQVAAAISLEATLSFLGIGIQPPEITWGLMISQGKQYLTTAWWLSFWPGLAIILTTLSLNLLSNWMRIALDPVQRWRLEMRGHKNG